MTAIRNIVAEKNEPIQSVGPNVTVYDAVATMCERHIGALLVREDDHHIGIVAERDIMRRLVLQRLDPSTTLVREIMTRDVLCINPDDDHAYVMALMTEKRIRHLPVVENARTVAMISIGDLVRWVGRHQDIEICAAPKSSLSA